MPQAEQLFARDSSGAFVLATADQIIESAKAALDDLHVRHGDFTVVHNVRSYFVLRMGALDHEVFSVGFLDAQHRLIACEDMFRGTLMQTSVYPREVVRRALHWNAASVLFAHNHPSGQATPSEADKMLTFRLRDALQLVDIRALDHIVVGGGSATSMAELGLM